MSGSSKILTVSYGTFSCTLEGFDDPFAAMRTIAEYFRDLAAEDRYFGAEPPTPDAELLQNLAEREARRRVEAQVSDNGIALRQLARAPVEPDLTGLTPDSDTKEPTNAFMDLGPPTHRASPDRLAEKLKRIRDVVTRSRDTTPATDQPSTAPSFDDDDQVTEATGASGTVTATPDEPEPGRSEAALRAASLETIRARLSESQLDEDDSSDDEDVAEAVELQLSSRRAEKAKALLELDQDEPDHANDSGDDDAERVTIDPSEKDESVATIRRLLAEVGVLTHDSYSPAAQDEREEETQPDAEAPAPEEAEEAPHAEVDEAAEGYEGPDAILRLVPDEPEDEARIPQRLSEAEDDMDRLMETAEQQFEDGEGQRRRRVVSQLRAAVLSAKADRAMGKAHGMAQENVESAYRDDLSRISKAPVQAQAESTAAMPGAPVEVEVEDDEDDAPLMLGTAQRVHPASEEPEEVHPQRVNRDPNAPSQQDAASFAEFAQKMGAEDLSDLLEAAAAYTAFVEGLPSFSRPQIMKRVARVKPQVELSREEGLRSFGQLLRQGKIQKLERGQFTISKSTRFNPGQRIAGE